VLKLDGVAKRSNHQNLAFLSRSRGEERESVRSEEDVKRSVMRGMVALAGLLVALLHPDSANAADYYVKNGGNDGLDGLSIATAWATPQHAADVVDPGDTVHVLNGTYSGFYLERSGTPGNPIAFLAESPAVEIVSDNGTTPDGINLEGASYVVIDGFTVNNRTRTGIRTVLAEFVTIRNCHCGFNGKWGILTGFVDDLTIEGNVTHDSQVEHGIYVSNSGDRPTIRGNVSYSNHANGIHMNGDASLGGDGIISNALVEGNVIYDNGLGGGSGINMDGVNNSIVRNNLLYDNHASGMSLYRIDGGAGSTGNLVVNNTIINASNGRWCVNISNGSSGNTVVNNILYNYHSFRGVITVDATSRPGLVSDYNSLMSRFSIDGGDSVISFATWQGLGYDANSFLAVPADHFIAPGSDFHLLDTSPAKDAGTASDAPAVDLDGNPRPVGAGYDMGAYEAQIDTCGDGAVDAGEQCGEPGLSCGDVCTSCAQCICADAPVTCGDGNLCGAETCEEDIDCPAGQVCNGCQCENPSACDDGVVAERPALKITSDSDVLKFSGKAVIPKPWSGIDPLVNGIRVIIDGVTGAGGIDVVIPGGPHDGTRGWKTNSAATLWRYSDRSGSAGGITRVVVADQSNRTAGLLRWSIHGKDTGVTTLPDVDDVRSTFIAGTGDECASMNWNPPAGERPRCSGDGIRLVCR
jgi:hypothetical protein